MLSTYIEDMSRLLWNLHKLLPIQYSHWGRLAEELKSRAIEVQIGPSRELYYVMPKKRFA
jgi:hypothetical protein